MIASLTFTIIFIRRRRQKQRKMKANSSTHSTCNFSNHVEMQPTQQTQPIQVPNVPLQTQPQIPLSSLPSASMVPTAIYPISTGRYKPI